VVLSDEKSSRSHAAGRDRFGLQLTTAWTCGGVVFYLLLPRAAPFILPLCAIAPLAWCRATRGRIPSQRPSAAFILLVLAGLYLLINATWSLSPSAAYSEIACYFMFIASLYLTLGTLREMDLPVLRAMVVGFVAGMLLGSAFVCFETFSQQAVYRLLISYAPAWGPAPRYTRMVAGSVSFLEPYLLDRSMTALVLLFWPAALVVNYLEVTRLRRNLLFLGLALAVAAVCKSVHATSKIALIGATASYVAYLVYPKLARWAVVTGWIAITLFVAPIAWLAYSQQLYLANWLAGSARERIVIWGYTSSQIGNAPLLGAGVSTTRALNFRDDERAPRAPGSPFRLTTGWHTHNAYLQVWYETGAVGALLLLAIGLLVIRILGSTSAYLQPYLFATFVGCMLMAGSSFSLWAPWFMASLGLAAVFAALGAAFAFRRQG
jgi:hypothetical protein